jgi:biotin-dependent carboxylase-like uncharacterized protein
MSAIVIARAGPLVTLQDAGRFGALGYGISASGPMDVSAFARAGAELRGGGTAIEFTRAGLAFSVESGVRASFAGGAFKLSVNGEPRDWPGLVELAAGDRVEITPGKAGNYGYVRFDREIDVPLVLGSRATNSIARLGGFAGRALKAGDRLSLIAQAAVQVVPVAARAADGPIRVVWGIHADLFSTSVRERFTGGTFIVSRRLDRMGVRLEDDTGVFANNRILSLVSDAIVPGDIQILGDGVPIILMRDHQPTGGYPRIATVIAADLDRFAQLRPGAAVQFAPVTAKHARALLAAGG